MIERRIKRKHNREIQVNTGLKGRVKRKESSRIIRRKRNPETNEWTEKQVDKRKKKRNEEIEGRRI